MNQKRRSKIGGAIVAAAITCGAPWALSGCGDSPPSVSSTRSEGTVHGVVKYKGTPVKGGSIRFDPANISRKDAPTASATIGDDGTYKVTTLQGTNMVRFDLSAELKKKAPDLLTYEKEYSVPSGDSELNIDLGQ